MQRIDEEPNFLFNLVFSEATFEVNNKTSDVIVDYGLMINFTITGTYTPSRKTERLSRCLKHYIDRTIFY